MEDKRKKIEDYLKKNDYQKNEHGVYIYKSDDETHRTNLAEVIYDAINELLWN